MGRTFDWTPKRDARLVELFNEDYLTLAQIAATLGCSVGTVRNRLGKLREKGAVVRKRAAARGVAKGNPDTTSRPK